MKKFWKWTNQAETETIPVARTLHLNGTIAEESWFDDDVTPQLFKEELMAGSGDITVCVRDCDGWHHSADVPGIYADDPQPYDRCLRRLC